MKKIAAVLLLALIATSSFAQDEKVKVKIKDEIAYVNETPYLNWKSKGLTGEISVSGINAAEEELYVMYLDYSDPNKVTSSNPEGKVRYIELNFVTLKKKCEISSCGHPGIVKLLYENSVYVNNVLSAENVDKLVTKYGTRFSQNRPGGSVNIYINE